MKIFYGCILFIIFLSSVNLYSQKMNIYKYNGSDTSFTIDEIDSITFRDQISAGDSVIFSDDFESHPAWSFPYYSDWKLMNLTSNNLSLINVVARVEGTYYQSGQKSFHVATADTDMILVNKRLPRTPDSIFFNVKVYLDKYATIPAKDGSVLFGFTNMTESISGENYAGLVVKSDGNLYCKLGPKESIISHLDLNRWYNLRLMFSVKKRTLSVWLNYMQLVPEFSGLLPTFGYKDFSIISTNSDIYFDELKIWEGR